MHVNSFRSFLFDGTCEYSVGGTVVSFHGRCGLGMTKFNEAISDCDGFLGMYIEGANFRFGGRCHDVLDDFGQGEDGAIELGACGVAQEEVASCSAASLGVDQVSGIAVDVKDHVTGPVQNFCIGIACGIVEEVDSGVVCASDIVTRRYSVDGMDHCVIHGAGIVEEFSGDLLDVFYESSW